MTAKFVSRKLVLALTGLVLTIELAIRDLDRSQESIGGKENPGRGKVIGLSSKNPRLAAF